MKKILITGGLGYIGSHAALELILNGDRVVLLDNLSNSSMDVLRRIELITKTKVDFFEVDIRDRTQLGLIFANHHFDAVMHFAGLKAVGEAQLDPLKYYDHNVVGSHVLIEQMAKAAVKTIVFSSSATVYGDPGYFCYSESTPLNPINVYGRTKLIVERMLLDLQQSDASWTVGILRYFNPVGAHPSGLIGEDPLGIPNNLMPYIARVATGKIEELTVFGNDYDTPDGTGLRDYIHVQDLAMGHLSALNWLTENPSSCLILNLGAGQPHSVLEMIRVFETVSNQKIRYSFGPRRAGDLACYYADPRKAMSTIGWSTKKSIFDMCSDHWRWMNTRV
jgi:UDP-glucose 4-epimerase